MKSPLKCRLFGHAWSKKLSDIPASSAFHRIDCTREGCDEAIDGVKAKFVLHHLEGSRVRRAVARRLPPE